MLYQQQVLPGCSVIHQVLQMMMGGAVLVVRSWRMKVVRVGQKPVVLLLVAIIERGRSAPVFQFRGQHLSPSTGSAGIV